jgi:hypothetical protein
MVILCGAELGKAMPIAPSSAADLKQQTHVKRDQYLTRFRTWLWEEKGVSFKFLVEQKPADPERVASLLVEYGKQLYYTGKAYGIYIETINAVASSRPLAVRSQPSDAALSCFCNGGGRAHMGLAGPTWQQC